MKGLLRVLSLQRNHRGATVVVVAVAMVVLIGFAALANDVFHIVVARNELKNAADAGALAGAHELYNRDGTVINTTANDVAFDAATANKSEKVDVEVLDPYSNDGDVQRGHWSFGLANPATRGFTPHLSTDVVDLWNVSTQVLDADKTFVNAVKVVARRETAPIASFFARILGHESFQMSAEAVAYIGFAGTLGPGEVDFPVAICAEAVLFDGEYRCNIGRMLNSGSVTADHNTAGWTNLTQPCNTADTTELRDLMAVCNRGNLDVINLGYEIGATGGVVDAIIGHPSQPNLFDCWKNGRNDTDGDGERDFPIDEDGDGWPEYPWNLTLPVILCPGNNVENCATTDGVVNVNLVWVLEKENDPDNDAPYKMYHPGGDLWENYDTSGQVRWDSFVTTFNLQTVDNQLATVENDGFKKKSLYFLPDCTPHDLKGGSGGSNYGVLARIPVLVD